MKQVVWLPAHCQWRNPRLHFVHSQIAGGIRAIQEDSRACILHTDQIGLKRDLYSWLFVIRLSLAITSAGNEDAKTVFPATSTSAPASTIACAFPTVMPP